MNTQTTDDILTHSTLIVARIQMKAVACFQAAKNGQHVGFSCACCMLCLSKSNADFEAMSINGESTRAH